MSNEKISSFELVSAISEQTGNTKKNATAFIRQFAETVETALLRDGIVKVKGFGTFKIIWNESRFSVNVQTGERYEIAGHNKISFTPDDELRDSVNRPFAHLDPVDLDGNGLSKTPAKPEEDPHMKRFSEQATEIVNMIADMQAFRSRKKEVVAENVEAVDFQENEAIVPPAETTSLEETIAIPVQEAMPDVEVVEPIPSAIVNVEPLPEPKPAEAIPVVGTTSTIAKPKPDDTVEEPIAFPVEKEIINDKNSLESELIQRMAQQPVKKSLNWLYILLLVVVLVGGGITAVCYFFPSFFKLPVAVIQVIQKLLL
jgi:nucleoid DNA-binding protein